MHQSLDLDVTTNALERDFPPGTTAEVVSVAALAGVLSDFTPGDYEGLRLTVEGPEDLRRMGWIVEQLGDDPVGAPFEQVIELARRWQALQAATVEAGRKSPAA